MPHLVLHASLSAGSQYAPFLLEHNSSFVVLWNAKGLNSLGKESEETGLARLGTALPGTDGTGTHWLRETSNPVLPTGTSAATDWDTYQAADPKVWWDDDHW